MDVNALSDYISATMLVVVCVLYIIGVFLKTIPNIPDWTIPFILLILGVLFAIAILGFTVEAIIQGVLVAGVTVLSNQLIKQSTNKRNT